jgi:pyruvate dehydrogenase E2 component (dihydrolipoamide acetyltransferase)
MPALSPTMTEGNLIAWHKHEGDSISPGEVIAEIETDKATMEVEAVDEGKLGKIVVASGTEGVSVNTIIAVLLEEGEVLDDANSVLETQNNGSTKSMLPNKSELVEPPTTEREVPNNIELGDTENVEKKYNRSDETRVFVSPLAKRMAEQAEIDLNNVKGSGPNGRIVKSDIDNILSSSAPQSKIESHYSGPNAPVADNIEAYEAVPNTSMRKAIARRLTESKQTAPHFYMTIDCEIDALLETRTQLNEKIESGKISVNDFVIRASALAMRQVPSANASWTEEETRIHKNVDISIAVAIDGGLITPIVKNADNKGLQTISDEMRDLAERARSGKLSPEEFQGGTFSISNLGMYGVKEFSAVINPPQGAILAVGAGEKRPVVKDNALAISTIMTCTLSVDHRVVDGAVGAEFLSAFKKLVEDPLTMLL